MKIFIDENVTHRFCPLLQAFDPHNDYSTIVETFGRGTKDPVWMRALSEVSGKVALLSYERNLLKDPACRGFFDVGNINLIYLRSAWIDIPIQEQMWMLLKSWPEVLRLLNENERSTLMVYLKGCRVRRA
ncbi:MAG: hypothetical protein IT365_08025 [Candidatus Hydrogenedentes bacterium]|nr:hypothetical protein [Candidatus Hydrogenedentota bacterium]